MSQRKKAAKRPEAHKVLAFAIVPLEDNALLAYAKILHRVALKKQQRIQQGMLANAA